MTTELYTTKTNKHNITDTTRHNTKEINTIYHTKTSTTHTYTQQHKRTTIITIQKIQQIKIEKIL